ncbi:hypothetical protein HOP50_13g70480 [Chloropicon primus]|uniref:Uncharacterized protein n=1 Tax=Chloropicon primus TaxID=1764295 RepID=A0A5B8MVC2_9CHLO|nr:hypothetical protein A3770_13p70270 [Chloropicon primus]UPR03718.1 hypothetical protein HOP50_13g70480 [Chloropicon primus]|eukprot:QDZ24509.1 hypothetical protein A3770_13p70270 [Chloropicon primus]
MRLRLRCLVTRRCTASVRQGDAGIAASRRRIPWPRRRKVDSVRAAKEDDDDEVVADADAQVDESEDGLLLESEDWTVRGNSLNPNTPLGRAVADACEELEDLAKLERQVQDEAFALLEKLGMKQTLVREEEEEEREGESGIGA